MGVKGFPGDDKEWGINAINNATPTKEKTTNHMPSLAPMHHQLQKQTKYTKDAGY